MSKNFEVIKTAAEKHMAELKVPGIAIGVITSYSIHYTKLYEFVICPG